MVVIKSGIFTDLLSLYPKRQHILSVHMDKSNIDFEMDGMHLKTPICKGLKPRTCAIRFTNIILLWPDNDCLFDLEKKRDLKKKIKTAETALTRKMKKGTRKPKTRKRPHGHNSHPPSIVFLDKNVADPALTLFFPLLVLMSLQPFIIAE